MLTFDTPPLPSPLREGTKTLRPNGGGDGGGETAIKKAFTLAEVLITLVIIGIIAAITVPTLINNSKWSEYKSGAWKAKNTLDNTVKMYQAKEGEIPQCGYWEKNPYGNSKCVDTDSNGDCIKYTLENGNPLPSDYNGKMNDCEKLYDFLLTNLNISKHCTSNAFDNGCTPHYNGLDDMNKSAHGMHGWKTENLKKGRAIVTTDGMIIIPYNGNKDPKILLIDINGQKGPNKFGHDLIAFRAIIKNMYSTPKFVPYVSVAIDKGGKDPYELMYGKNK